MTPDASRLLDSLRLSARADARAMGVPYDRRLDDEAASLGFADWRALQDACRRGRPPSPDVRLVVEVAVAGRPGFVDGVFAARVRAGAVDDEEEAYRDMVASTTDGDGLAAALSDPTLAHGGRREAAWRTLWTGAAGHDRAVRLAGELLAATTTLAITPATRDADDVSPLLPRLWDGRSVCAHMMRDVVAGIRDHAEHADGPIVDQEAGHRHAERWWSGLATALAARPEVSVSGAFARLLVDARAAGGRRTCEEILRERLEIACTASGPVPPIPADRIGPLRDAFEADLARRLVPRFGGTPAERRDDARAVVDALLGETGAAFGDPAWSWNATMARQLAAIATADG